jgi:hypothetical protein
LGQRRVAAPGRDEGQNNEMALRLAPIVLGLLGAMAARADGQIDGVALLAAVWAAAQACFIRAGIAGQVAKPQ